MTAAPPLFSARTPARIPGLRAEKGWTTDRGWFVWLVGAALGVAFVGPGLGSGALLNLDLVATDQWPAPRSFWGLGPELARAVPFEMALSGMAWLVGGDVAVKAYFVLAIATAFVGAHRLARQLGSPPLARWSTAFLYAASPFLLTRVGVGHLTMVGAFALLPWVQRRLLVPSEQPWRTFLAAAALATMGFYGGILAVVSIGAGLLLDRPRRVLAVAGAAVTSQLAWLVPGAIQLAQGPDLGDASNFPSGLATWAAVPRVLTGHGFWQSRFQAGGEPAALLTIVAVVIVGLTAMAWRQLEWRWSGPAVLAAAIAMTAMLADAIPGLDNVYDALTALPGLAALREPQRLAPLVVLPIAIAVPSGASVLAWRVPTLWRSSVRLVPLAIAVMLGSSSLWGIDGALRPHQIPPSWAEARALTRAEPGTILVLPWHRYQNSAIAGERRVLSPALQFFGPDVIASSDLELDSPTRETIDPREPHVEALLADLQTGRPVADRLAAIGIRWVLIVHDVDYETYLPMVDEVGVASRQSDLSLDLVEVTTWRDDGVDRAGGPFAPLASAGDGATVWHEPWAPGWFRGLTPASESPTGLVGLPGGNHRVWYWPALIVTLGHVVGISLVLVAVRHWR